MKTKSRAFTQTELLATVAALFLVALVVAPAIATTKSDSGRSACFNNLRLVGRGVQMWAADHGHQFSWRTLVSDGGVMPGPGSAPRPGNAWFDYMALSNELVTPAILACPSDAGVLRSRSFYEFTQAPYRNNAVSYPLHLDGSPDLPRSWLSGDRNLSASSGDTPCSARVHNAVPIYFGDQSLRWTNAVHGIDLGHILTTDGSVEFTDSTRMREIILQQGIDDNGQLHFLKAR